MYKLQLPAAGSQLLLRWPKGGSGPLILCDLPHVTTTTVVVPIDRGTTPEALGLAPTDTTWKLPHP